MKNVGVPATPLRSAESMPAMVPLPRTAAQPTGGRISPRLTLVTSHEAPSTAAGFPATYARKTPMKTVRRRGYGSRLLASTPA